MASVRTLRSVWSGRCLSTTSTTAAPVAHDLESLRQQLRKSDFENYLCGNLLPSSARLSFFVMRALNLELATVRDAARGNPMTGHVRMAFWRDFVSAGFKGQELKHPLHATFRQSVATHGHTKRWLDRLVEARDADLDGRAHATVADLETYAEHTASSLLYLTLEAVGVRDERADIAASHLGKAIGLSIVLHALPVHSRLGQRYIPDELMIKHNLSEDKLLISPEEVTTADGKPLVDPEANKKDASAFASAAQSASMARAGGGFSTGSTGVAFELSPSTPAAHGHSHVHGPDCAHEHGPAPAQPSIKPSSGGGSSGIRLTESRAAKRMRDGGSAQAKPAPGGPTNALKQNIGLNSRGTGPISPTEAAASAALRSGLGASQLILHKDEETMSKIQAVTKELAGRVQQHLTEARKLSGSVPDAAKAALLPAVPVSRFLARLDQQGYDVYKAGGLGPWQDGRAYARLGLQWDLIKHTLTNSY